MKLTILTDRKEKKMKKFLVPVILIVAIFSILAPAKASAETRSEKLAINGWFEIDHENEVVIWHRLRSGALGETDLTVKPTGEGGNAGVIFGKVTKATKLQVVNREGVSLANLDLLNHRKVMAYAEYRIVNPGEGEKKICDKLVIIVER